MHKIRVFGWGLWLGLMAVLPCYAGDTVRLHNLADETAGVLVDGAKGQAAVNDARYTTLELGTFFDALFPVIPLGDFTLAAEANEIVAFARRRPAVLVEDVPWTQADNAIHVTFPDEFAIPVYVWIVQGPFESVSASALDAQVATAAIWAAERQGVRFSVFDVRDATTNPDAGPLLDFRCSEVADLVSLIGHEPDGLNIYYVDTVDFGQGPGTGNGVWCGSTYHLIAMGRNSSPELLAHEIGHAFRLSHTNVDTEFFDTTNVMHNASSIRQYLTEGQIFRSIFHADSSINRLYDLRPGGPTRLCGHYTDHFGCPVVQKRIWADGPSWPPN